jgi:hypothetical protein
MAGSKSDKSLTLGDLQKLNRKLWLSPVTSAVTQRICSERRQGGLVLLARQPVQQQGDGLWIFKLRQFSPCEGLDKRAVSTQPEM